MLPEVAGADPEALEDRPGPARGRRLLPCSSCREQPQPGQSGLWPALWSLCFAVNYRRFWPKPLCPSVPTAHRGRPCALTRSLESGGYRGSRLSHSEALGGLGRLLPGLSFPPLKAEESKQQAYCCKGGTGQGIKGLGWAPRGQRGRGQQHGDRGVCSGVSGCPKAAVLGMWLSGHLEHVAPLTQRERLVSPSVTSSSQAGSRQQEGWGQGQCM